MAAVDISPAAALHRRAKYPTATALVYEGQEFSAAHLSRTAVELAAGLAEQGLRRGDRIAYLGFNSVTFLQTLFAAAHLGAVFVPVNFRLAADEVRHILIDSGAHTLVVEEGHRELVESVLDDVPARHHLLIDTDPACPATGATAAVWTPLSRLLGADRPTREPVPLYDDDLAALMYTSGTTGRPKGVMLTHGNLWWNAVNVDSVVDTRTDDVNLAVAPLFHIGGLNALTLRTLLRGGTVVLRRAFDPAQFLDDLVQHRVTSFFAVPAMCAAVARVPGFAEADLSALRAAVVAGAPVPPQLIKDYAERGIMLQQAWGLTETAPFATYLPAPLTLEKTGSAGAPMPYTEICLTHPGTGARIDEADTRGEICVRGPNVTPGYWNNPDATAAAFDDVGWFHSGDIAHRDKDGFYYIVDRLKDMIISGGENVYPAEVERVLAACPGVLEAAVIGVPDPKWGETVLAVLTCAPGTVLTLEEVREYAGGHLARYKLPTRLMLVDHLPRNASGKLAKAELRRMAETEPATDTA
ncbi:long-chain fatty acid--CoA ligase [Streptomyces ipomoeae]|jgi:fatty-acyl-CoA synthase|uniref:Putative long-chain-fatty-acid--CoA ligase n=1 Tax=Streptomyces ipomoeae 91-03 TaxID=698759 RepID=L1KMB9_9ACTN|nr:long-chain fatty acid--CoA ligase [Streptomyces ipomoeae]EKX61737.1 putative long-chain-fatty-acid--CoA ligase [Streptomyces ipomoeae 91-03]MDX2692511.1 long-chain fatty acid--CoA ligase [Streptomyces ipomoeae]MDX2821999.1 long-chain fatty acid--CoA ligase [Streptomyces ipomoeae]MDX2838148.1 long-chain fatty acid--CoA ligase [Streptomyces ipomoeae]MDX2877062.1 long-chain fatty acid--CoA ligase [Streptomyces ipomoeae]